jgi:hypothetical protein
LARVQIRWSEVWAADLVFFLSRRLKHSRCFNVPRDYAAKRSWMRELL